MKKIILSLLVVISGFLALVLSSIYLTDYSKIYADFMSGSSINSNIAKINYRIHNFPVPALIIDEIKDEGKVELKNVKIKFSLWSVLSFSHKISDIEVDQVMIYLSNDNVTYINHDEFIAELIKKEALNVSAKIKKLVFVESDKDVAFSIENFIFSGDKKTTKFTGELSVGNLKGEFIRNPNQIDFNFKLDNPGYTLELKEVYEQSVLKSGKIEITTSALAKELVSSLPDFVNLSEQSVSDEEVKITMDLLPLNNWINFKNILIQSKSIQGSGEIALSKNKQDISDIKINFSKIDLKDWGKNKSSDKQNKNVSSYSSGITNKLVDFRQNIRITLSAQEVILGPNNKITDVSIKFLNKDNQLTIEDFFGTLDKSGGFRVSGTVSENSFRSLFKGRIAINHKDLNDLAEFIGGSEVRTKNNIPYSLVSDIKFSAVDVSMQDLLIKTDSSEITGSFSTKFIGNSPRTSANLKVNKANLDKGDLPLLNHLYKYAMNLTKDSKKEEYLNKFIPLREIDSISDYDVSFDKLTFNNKLYKNVNFNLNLMPGQIKLDNLVLNDGKNYADITVELVASAIKPSFNITMHNGELEVDFLSPRSISELKKQILEEFALDKVDLNIDLNLDKVYQGDFSLGRLMLKAKNNKTLFEISKFDADMFGGRMYSTGSILLEPYTLNFVYALNSASIPEIAKLMPVGFIETNGLISTSGMWSTNGNSIEEQLYNLYTKSNIITKDITISNFSIDEMVKATTAPGYNLKAFKDDMKQALLTGKTEVSELKTDVELTKGLFNFKNIEFKTKYTAGAAAATFNIYDMNIDLASVFSFYLSKPNNGRSYNDYATAKLTVKAVGNLFTPKKEVDSKEFEDLLNATMTVMNNQLSQ